jgi:hypothetical protein
VGASGMHSNEAFLGYLLIAIIAGFASLIFLLLKYRRRFLEGNLLLTADQVWPKLSNRAEKSHFARSDLLFGIWQDGSATTPLMIVKNARSKIVGRVEFLMVGRSIKISTEGQIFEIALPLTWRRTANLKAENESHQLASYEKIGWLTKQKFEIPGYGTLIAERPSFSLLNIVEYRLNNILVGTAQEFSKTRKDCRIIILPSTLPLAVRIFIMTM